MNNEQQITLTDEQQREYCGGLNFNETITLYKALKVTGEFKATCTRLISESLNHHSRAWRIKAAKLHARLCEAETMLGDSMRELMDQKKQIEDGFDPNMN